MNQPKHRDEYCDVHWKKYRHTPAGKVLAGILVIAVGAVLLARQLDVPFPTWLFTWPVLVIVLGLYTGARHLFTNSGWIILVVVGSIFLYARINPDTNIETLIWPLLIIIAGLLMVFKSLIKRKTTEEEVTYNANGYEAETTSSDMIHTVSVFSGVKKNIVSKNFKGGDITCVLGGAEINLSQADIQGTVVLEVTQVLGGTKLIIPTDWDVQPEMVAVLGGIEDKRQMLSGTDANKILVLRGTSILGGIEIKSF